MTDLKWAGYCLTCCSEKSVLFSLLLRTNQRWLRSVLKRENILDCSRLSAQEVHLIAKKLPVGTTIGFDPSLEYTIDFGRSYVGKVPDKTGFRVKFPSP